MKEEHGYDVCIDVPFLFFLAKKKLAYLTQ